MPKTKIAFFINFLKIGGVEKALLNLVKTLPKEKFDATVYVGIKEGELLEEIEKYAKVEEIPGFEDKIVYDFKSTAKKYIKNKNYIKLIKIFLRKLSIKLQKKETNLLALDLKKIEKKFDIVVAYQVPISAITVYVAENVNANKKILWAHCDMMSVDKKIIDRYEKYIDKFQKIVSVSEETNKHFKELMPKQKGKCIYVDNVLDIEGIRELSKVKIDDMNSEKEEIKLLTVARLAKGKGIDLAIDTTRKLIDNGYKIKWFIVGDGEERENLENKIKENNIEKNFILLGSRKNPYPYFKNCDIYIQTSEFEGACTATIEAKILEKPIITTNTSGVNKNFINEKNSLIVNYDSSEIYNSIVKMLNPDLRQKFVDDIIKDGFKQNNNFLKILDKEEKNAIN